MTCCLVDAQLCLQQCLEQCMMAAQYVDANLIVRTMCYKSIDSFFSLFLKDLSLLSIWVLAIPPHVRYSWCDMHAPPECDARITDRSRASDYATI